MEPKLPAPNRGPEQSPMGYGQQIERTPVPSSPEVGLERRTEQIEQRSETAPTTVHAPAAPALPPVVVPMPPPVDDTAAAPIPSDTPLVANDDDLIEKEWVDKAKKIIVETRDDPYRREQEVSKLQADYLQKRYGKELGAS